MFLFNKMNFPGFFVVLSVKLGLKPFKFLLEVTNLILQILKQQLKFILILMLSDITNLVKISYS